MILKLLELIVMMLGSACMIVIIMMFIDYLVNKIKRIMKRQSKIRCLCKHEYVNVCASPIFEENYETSVWEHIYKCRKCGKILKFNIVREEKDEL